mmetsp:Transcript_34756/g.34413  ORF Transcript_34756/g.34413 Transcript_34756/m.34413 type:complete len:89 (+) Transcript_34756:373-639(+)
MKLPYPKWMRTHQSNTSTFNCSRKSSPKINFLESSIITEQKIIFERRKKSLKTKIVYKIPKIRHIRVKRKFIKLKDFKIKPIISSKLL